MPKLYPFIGRKKELESLNLLLEKRTSSLVVVQGRRRIGKSRLIQEFGKTHRFLSFSGLPPTPKTTAETERDEFMRQLSIVSDLPEIKVDDWGKAFFLLSKEVKTGRVVILFDEISWMGSKDPDFLGKLKNAWDSYFKSNPELILVFCGSISTWIEKNILSSTGFMGRISLTLTLKELPLIDCSKLLTELGMKLSPYEKFKILSITGGVPRYLEEFHSHLSVEENIKRLCYMESGVLFREFESIFSDLFSNRSATYRQIVNVLVEGSLELNDICTALNMPKSGLISEYLEDLMKSGFISRDYTWNLKTGETSRLSHYRLSDNYVRFYLKYIEKNKDKIEKGYFEDQPLVSLPNWDGIMGLQFENMVLNLRKKIWDVLHIYPSEIISDNPFFQRKTTRTQGCQIDYMIHTRNNILYVFEIKFSKNPIKREIITEMEKKLNALSIPKHFAYRPVLIHVNGVEESVIDSDYFSNIIDFSKFLEA